MSIIAKIQITYKLGKEKVKKTKIEIQLIEILEQ